MAPVRSVWGPAATLGWGALLTLLVLGAQIFTGAILLAVAPRAIDRGVRLDGDLVGAPILASALAGLAAVALVVALKGGSIREYLALRWPGWKPLLAWLGVVALLAAGYDLAARLLGRPLVPTVMLEAWQTADWRAPFLVALLAGAPAIEETLFRGFFFTGLAESRLGPTLAIVLPAVLWSLLHLQYDAFDLSFVLLGGLALGLARWKSGSLLPCLLAHGVINLVATLEMAAIS